MIRGMELGLVWSHAVVPRYTIEAELQDNVLKPIDAAHRLRLGSPVTGISLDAYSYTFCFFLNK
jgi:hypothetical protein